MPRAVNACSRRTIGSAVLLEQPRYLIEVPVFSEQMNGLVVGVGDELWIVGAMLEQVLDDFGVTLANGELKGRHIIVLARHQSRVSPGQFLHGCEVASPRGGQDLPNLGRRGILTVL